MSARDCRLVVMTLAALALGLGLGRQMVKGAATTGVTPAMEQALVLQQAYAQAVERVKPATVAIETDQGSGTGFIFTPEGAIMTNHHVIERARSVSVKLPDRDRPVPARVVGTDPFGDVAVLQISVPGKLPVAKLGDSDKVDVGNLAIAIGHPMELDQTATFGHISATGRVTKVTGENSAQDYLQTDAAINPGNSGGPLLNIVGEVIGVNNHILSETGGSAGLGFAVPINAAKVIAGQLLATGRMTRSWLGVSVRAATDDELARLGGAVGGRPVVLEAVRAGGPAAAVGLAAGDVVLVLDGHHLRDAADFINRVQLTPVGQTVKLTLLRAAQVYRVELRAEAAPVTRRRPRGLGIEAVPVVGWQRARAGLPAFSGLQIVTVQPDSPADRAGLQRGQVLQAINGRPTRDAPSFQLAWAKAVGGDGEIVLTVDGRAVKLPLDEQAPGG